MTDDQEFTITGDYTLKTRTLTAAERRQRNVAFQKALKDMERLMPVGVGRLFPLLPGESVSELVTEFDRSSRCDGVIFDDHVEESDRLIYTPEEEGNQILAPDYFRKHINEKMWYNRKTPGPVPMTVAEAKKDQDHG